LASAIFSRIFYRLFASAAEPVEPLAADVFVAARLRLTRMTPPTMRTVAATFYQDRVSRPVQMLTMAAMMGWR
jgi:hypothetical protein